MNIKMLKFLPLLAAVLLSATSCMKGIGTDDGPDLGPDLDTFEVFVSASVIYANGTDAAVFTARFGQVQLAADLVTVYDAATNTPVELPDLSFTTTETGKFRFYLTYTDDEGTTHRSDELEITAVTEVNLDPVSESGLTVYSTTSVFEAGKDRVLLVIRYNGEVLDSGYTIYDAKTDQAVELPSVELSASDGTLHNVPYFATETAGTYGFWVSYKTASTMDKPVSILVTSFPVPVRPADPQPDNTSFKRRTLLTQFTGTACGYCPYMIASIETVAADAAYADSFTLAVAHTYNIATDKAAMLSPYQNFGTAFGISGAPYLNVDMRWLLDNYGVDSNVANIKARIDESLSTPAAAGVSARVGMDGTTMLVRATVKAAAAGDYRVGLWVLESGIYQQQSNYSTLSGYDFNTHNNALRIADSQNSRSDYSGYDLGTLAEGEVVDHLFSVELDESMNTDKCHLVLFVTARNTKNNSWYVVNSASNKTLAQTIEFEYE